MNIVGHSTSTDLPWGKGSKSLEREKKSESSTATIVTADYWQDGHKSLSMAGFSVAQQPRTSPEVQFGPVIHKVGHFMSQAHKRVDH